MNIFDSLAKYANQYSVVSRRNFNDVEKSAVLSADVVASEYGLSVCFLMISGGKTYIPVSRDSVCSVGDKVNLDTAELLVLSREGSDPINRVEVK